MESSLSPEESHKVPWMKGGLNPRVWSDVRDMILTTTSPSQHTWHLAWNPGHGTVHRKAKLVHWVDPPPTMKICIKSTSLWILQLSFLNVPQMVHKPFAWMMTEESEKAMTEHVNFVYPHFAIASYACYLLTMY